MGIGQLGKMMHKHSNRTGRDHRRAATAEVKSGMDCESLKQSGRGVPSGRAVVGVCQCSCEPSLLSSLVSGISSALCCSGGL